MLPTTVEIPESVRDQFVGLHDLYFTFVGNDPVDEEQVYVANVDYFDSWQLLIKHY